MNLKYPAKIFENLLRFFSVGIHKTVSDLIQMHAGVQFFRQDNVLINNYFINLQPSQTGEAYTP